MQGDTIPKKPSAPDHLEVARLARHLWQLAGTPAGRFQEFWNRALEATAAAQRQLTGEPMDGDGGLGSRSGDLP